MKKGLLFASALSLLLSSSYAAGQELLADSTINTHTNSTYQEKIQKINDDFYLGKVPGKNLWAVVQRLTEDNCSDWSDYANKQYKEIDDLDNKHLSLRVGRPYHPGGVDYFRQVIGNYYPYESLLEHYKEDMSRKHERVWIAYLTDQENPQNSDNKDAIKIFVTITSGPNAKVTTHMGVSRSINGFKTAKETPNISMDLHSFAAKVMLVINPQLRYMINAPIASTAAIMAKSLPNDKVFVGQRSDLETLNKYLSICALDQDIKLSEFEKLHPDWASEMYTNWDLENIEIQKKIEQYCYSIPYVTTRYLDAHPEEEECPDQVFYDNIGLILKGNKFFSTYARRCVDFDRNKGYTLNVDNLNQYKEERLKHYLEGMKKKHPSKLEYTYIKAKSEEDDRRINVEFLTNHPPIIDIARSEDRMLDKVKIYPEGDWNNPWLEIKRGEMEHQWFFYGYNIPGIYGFGYLAVDLEALADCRELE